MTSRRVLFPLTAVLILGYFLFFNWQSLHMYLDTDDMYALYFGWVKPLGQIFRENFYLWKGEFRPFGAFFYRVIFAIFGFNAVPFRIAALGVCLFDTWLCFWFTRLISGSERTAALAALLFTFQVRMIEVWWRTTVIFDSLCFTFAFLIVGLYIKERRERGDLTGGAVVALLLLFICALNSKEFAVTVPLFLVVWELLFNTAKLRTFLKSRAALAITVMGVLTLIYLAGKLKGAQAMVNNPFYTPVYNYARFTETWGEYMKDLFVLQARPVGAVSMSILGCMLAAALALRSRVLIFAWVIIFFGLLPVSFAPARGGYEIYYSWIGWVIYAGALLVALQDMALRAAPQYRTALACVVFVLVGWRYGKWNLHALRTENRDWLYGPPAEVRDMAQQLKAMHGSLPKNSRVMFIEDGFTTGEWTPLFVLRLLYQDPAMVVDRIKSKTERPAGWLQYTSGDRVHYDYVFTYDSGHYQEVPSAIAKLQGLELKDRAQK